VILLIGVAALQFGASAFGFSLSATPKHAQPLWPPTGVLLALLLACERRVWPWIAAGTILGALAADLRFGSTDTDWLLELGYVLISVLEAGAAAIWLQLIFYAPELLVRTRNVIAFVLILAGISLGGAALATLFTWATTGLGGFADLQIWWAGDYLGMALIAPLVLHALRPGSLPTTFARVSPWEPPLQVVVLTLACMAAFGGSVEPRNLAEVPYIIYPVLVWMAFRAKPPQLVLVGLLIVAWIAIANSRAGHGPFAHSHFSSFSTMISVQIFLVVTTVTILLLAATIFERRNALLAQQVSDERYRSFVRNAHDAIWRVEIDPALPLTASPRERSRWLAEHSRVAEHNDAYANVGATSSVTPRPWRSDRAWFEACSSILGAPDLVPDGNIEAKVQVAQPDGDERIMLCELSFVVESRTLQRIWGVAMDITGQERSQSELEAQRAELRALAARLLLADEKARRAVAADLHDGIGQNLSAIVMWAASLRESVDATERKEILDHVRLAATESLQWTREIIADLSPPGLYDMGLESALNGLVARVRERHSLSVVVDRCELPATVPVETTVTLFQCLRELLFNVVKHAAAHEIRIDVHFDGSLIRASVIDDGRGFDSARVPTRPSEHGGFGLFMMRERLMAIQGSLAIEHQARGGTCITVAVPHPPR
jgi:signal transduction histidine kinase